MTAPVAVRSAGGFGRRGRSLGGAKARGVRIAAVIAVVAIALTGAVASRAGGGGGERGVAARAPGVSTATVELPAGPLRTAFADRAVWIPIGDENEVIRVDAASLQKSYVEDVGDYPSAVAAGGDKVWVANENSNTVQAIDVASNELVERDAFRVGHEPVDIAVAGRYVWTANCGCEQQDGHGTVSRIDLRARRVRQFPVGPYPLGLGVDPSGVVWVTSEDGYLRALDPDSGAVIERIKVHGDLTDVVTYGDASAWLASASKHTLRRVKP